MVSRTFTCSCGEPIGVSEWPARSEVDNRELGPAYLAFDRDHVPAYGSTPYNRLLWRVGTGDAGAFDQRCPRCERVLPMDAEPQVEAEGSGAQLALEL